MEGPGALPEAIEERPVAVGEPEGGQDAGRVGGEGERAVGHLGQLGVEALDRVVGAEREVDEPADVDRGDVRVGAQRARVVQAVAGGRQGEDARGALRHQAPLEAGDLLGAEARELGQDVDRIAPRVPGHRLERPGHVGGGDETCRQRHPARAIGGRGALRCDHLTILPGQLVAPAAVLEDEVAGEVLGRHRVDGARKGPIDDVSAGDFHAEELAREGESGATARSCRASLALGPRLADADHHIGHRQRREDRDDQTENRSIRLGDPPPCGDQPLERRCRHGSEHVSRPETCQRARPTPAASLDYNDVPP